jgi:peroxisomal 2,4-dienoyl-CoA reductase
LLNASLLAGLSANAFRTVLEIDTLGTYNTFKSTIDELVKTKGSLIAISATLHYRGMPLQAHVSAAKAGIDALIRAVAVEYGPRGVRANVSRLFPVRSDKSVFHHFPLGSRLPRHSPVCADRC